MDPHTIENAKRKKDCMLHQLMLFNPAWLKAPVTITKSFPQFTKLPTGLQRKVFAHCICNKPPQILHKGSRLARAQGVVVTALWPSRPFISISPLHISILRSDYLTSEYAKLLLQPICAEHIFKITDSNIHRLQSRTFTPSAPITTFRYLTFYVRLPIVPTTSFFAQIRVFIARFTSAVNVEVYFENIDGMRNFSDDSSEHNQILFYDIKNALKALPKIGTMVISCGISYEHVPSYQRGFRRRERRGWMLYNPDEISGVKMKWHSNMLKSDAEVKALRDMPKLRDGVEETNERKLGELETQALTEKEGENGSGGGSGLGSQRRSSSQRRSEWMCGDVRSEKGCRDEQEHVECVGHGEGAKQELF